MKRISPNMAFRSRSRPLLALAFIIVLAWTQRAGAVNEVANNASLLCDFDYSMCSFSSGANGNPWDGNVSWTRISGSTPTFGTGPDEDHTRGSASGAYIYVESSEPNFPFAGPFELKAPLVGGAGVITFWYHFWGMGCGVTTVAVKSPDQGWAQWWSKRGNQGNSWQCATISINDAAATHWNRSIWRYGLG